MPCTGSCSKPTANTEGKHMLSKRVCHPEIYMLNQISFPALQTKHEDTIPGEQEKTEKVFKFRFSAQFAQAEIETNISQNFAPI